MNPIISLMRFRRFYRAFLPGQLNRERGFTLLESVLSLSLMMVFAGMLVICMSQVLDFIRLTSENARQYREFRAFYEVLLADCQGAILGRRQVPLELKLPSKEGGECSLTLFRRFSRGWEYSLVAQGEGSAICAIQYRFQPATGVLSRSVWGCQESLAVLSTAPVRVNGLSEKAPVLSRNLLHHIDWFQLYPIDGLGKRQRQWMGEMSAGLECSVRFSHRRLSQTISVKLPILKMVHEDPSKNFATDHL